MSRFDVIAFDADDTLWHNERLYAWAQSEFQRLLAHYHSPEWIAERLFEAEMRNLQHYGYGVKAFALSMIETAVELTEGRVSGSDIGELVGIARTMLSAEVELLEHVTSSLEELSQHYRLIIITKGDLLDQERKVLASGLSGYFSAVHVVSNKDEATYQKIFQQHQVPFERVMMIGNSLRSDILPILALGGSAVHIPYELTWAHEDAEVPADTTLGFYALPNIGALPELLARLEQDLA
jgi:putative hydrolase of the HAD superfamily